MVASLYLALQGSDREARVGHCGSIVGNHFYVFGGDNNYGDHSTFQRTERYDTASKKWEVLGQIPTPPTFAAAVAYAGKIYVVGGLSSHDVTMSDLQCFDPSSNKWTRLAPMPVASSRLAMVTLNGKLYVAGGIDHRNGRWYDANELHVYDPAKNQWSKKAAMKLRRHGLCLAAWRGKLYAMGGQVSEELGRSRAVEIFDPATNTWASGADMTVGRCFFGCAVAHDRLVVFGNTDGGRMEELDPATMRWKPLATTDVRRQRFAYGVMGNTIYVTGGDGNETPYLLAVPLVGDNLKR